MVLPVSLPLCVIGLGVGLRRGGRLEGVSVFGCHWRHTYFS